jgi:diguanylate cyclase (GGDEF)-like protein/PAS domain S-box-containing protein
MTTPRAALGVADLLDILPDAVLMVDAQGHICYANPALHTTLGYEAEELLDQPLSVLVPQAARERHEAMMARFRIDGPPKLMGSRPVLHAVHRSGRVVPVSISLTNFTLADGQRVTVAVVHDVTALHTDLDRATALAETDALTGLGNRLRLQRRIEALLMSQRPFAVLYLDLEGFKQLNDRRGHAAGDQALRTIARRLRSQVREADLAVRLGGDQFVVLLDGVDDAGRLETRARALAERLMRPFRVEDGSDRLGVHVGGAISPHHARTHDALLAAADAAMYAAKRAGEVYRLADG